MFRHHPARPHPESSVPTPGTRRPVLAAALAAILGATPSVAQEAPPPRGEDGSHQHAHGGHHEGLHFAHPLIAESVSPDTKVRIDHRFFEFPDGDNENSGVLEAEYAVTRSFSVEAGIPYSYTATEAGNAEILLKFANYAFEEAGVLLGYGIEFGFPTNGTAGAEAGEDGPRATTLRAGRNVTATGSGAVPASRTVTSSESPPPPRFSGGGGGVEATLGTDEWEVAPFLNAGFKRGPVELVAWGTFGIPFDQAEQSEVSTELSWNFSGLYHVSSRVQALLELDGSGGISGEAVGEDVANLSPGIRVQVLPHTPLVLGTSVGFPLTDEEPFDARWKSSVFLHF